MNIKQIINFYFKKTKLPAIDMELILAYVLKKSREYILAHPEKELSKLQISNYKLQIAKLAKGRPLAYIAGEKEFYGFNFKVNKNVLIPRPETELMVDEAMRRITHNAQRVTLIDVGTGSGCVIIALAKLIKNYELRITNYELIGIDISNNALMIAKQNARLNGIGKNIKFLQGNLLEPILKFLDSRLRGNDIKKNSKILILANLPYLTPSQIKNSPSIKYEPRIALSAGKDGLKYYRQLFRQIVKLKTKLCVTGYALCEIDPAQKIKIKQLIKKELPEANFEIKKDLKGHNRLVIINI